MVGSRSPIRKSALVIDDEPSTRELLTRALRDDFQVFTAVDGLEGVKIAKDRRVNLVVTDIRMPKQDGIETLLELRHEFPFLKIVVVSGDDAGLQRAKSFSADLVLSKPFSIAEIKQKISKLMG